MAKANGGHPHLRRTKQLTASAAASLVLTVAPVAPVAIPPTSDRPGAVYRAGAHARVRVARRRFVSAARLAHRQYRTEQQQAHQRFREQVEPISAMYAADRDSGGSRQRRLARKRWRLDTARFRLGLGADLALANQRYIERWESARLAYLVEANAASDVVAGAQYRRALNVAAAEYHLRVVNARNEYRLAIHAAQPPVASPGRRSTGMSPDHSRRRQELAGVLALRLRQARESFQAKVTLARGTLQTSFA